MKCLNLPQLVFGAVVAPCVALRFQSVAVTGHEEGFLCFGYCPYPNRIIDLEKLKESIPQHIPEGLISPHLGFSQYVLNCMVEDAILKKTDENIYYMDEFEERYGFFENYHLSEKHYL